MYRGQKKKSIMNMPHWKRAHICCFSETWEKRQRPPPLWPRGGEKHRSGGKQKQFPGHMPEVDCFIHLVLRDKITKNYENSNLEKELPAF